MIREDIDPVAADRAAIWLPSCSDIYVGGIQARLVGGEWHTGFCVRCSELGTCKEAADPRSRSQVHVYVL